MQFNYDFIYGNVLELNNEGPKSQFLLIDLYFSQSSFERQSKKLWEVWKVHNILAVSFLALATEASIICLHSFIVFFMSGI